MKSEVVMPQGEAGQTPQAIYLDYQATTPVDPRVLEAMLPYFTQHFGNAHSSQHAFGRRAEAAVEAARGEVAALLNADPREIVFTSGATEGNNTAIKGAARFHGRLGKRHLVTVATEHKCVLESCKAMEREGFEVTVLGVKPDGLLDLQALAAAIREDTALVSVMAVNNEIGVIQPLGEIGALCQERGVLFHTDAAQATGKIPLDVAAMKLGLLSLSGHKMYAPKGVGALYIRRRPRARIEPLMDGGGQERTLRSGTLAVPLIVGLGEACRIAREEMAAESQRLRSLRNLLLERLRAELPEVWVNGDPDERVPGNLSLTIPGLRAERLIEALPEIAVSTASACSSAAVEPSYVLSALGLSDEDAACSLRIGLGRQTSEAELLQATEAILSAAQRLKAA